MASVSFRNATRIYPGGTKPAVDKLNLEVRDGEFLVLVGPSGCGKSTSLRMLAGLEEVNEGGIYIGDREVTDVPPKDRDIAMVFQNYALYPHMSVAENMGFALKIAGVNKDERAARVLEAAKLLDLEPYLNRKPKALSGGQRQRVAMGRAIVRQPQVFLMDEPLSNLDAKLRVQTRTQIASLQRRLGVTTVYVTHDQVEAMTLGSRIAVFNKGVIEQIGAPLEVYQRPANMFVASFMGAPKINLVAQPGSAAELAHQALWRSLAGERLATASHLGVRPEHLQVHGSGEGVAATVALAEHLGDSSVLHMRVPGVADLLKAKVPANSGSFLAGQMVFLRAPAEAILGFDATGKAL